MSTSEESDEHGVSSHAVHGLLTVMNMNTPSYSNQSSNSELPTWSLPSTSSSRNSPSPATAELSTSASIFPSQTVSRRPSNLQTEPDPAVTTPPQQPSLFNTPNRSIFSSGPPTSSLSANTAQASMSAPPSVNSSRPLSALTVPSSSATRRSVHYHNDGTHRNRIPRAEKDVDDPSISTERSRSVERRGTSTPTALTRLFAAPEASTPTVSRHASYIRTLSGTAYTRGRQMMI